MPAAAGTLDDLRAALRRLSVDEPVRGTLTIEQSVKSAGRFANNSAARLATAEVGHDANGVTISIPQTLIRRTADEVSTPRAAQTSAQDAVGSIRTLAVFEALNVRDSLLGMLADASVVEEKRSTLNTKPARLLVLKLQPQRRQSANTIQIGSVKAEDRLRLWIGDDNLPLAAERVESTVAGFMFLHGTYSAQTSYTYAHAHNRLVLTRVEVAEGGSGAGQKVEKRSVQTLTLH